MKINPLGDIRAERDHQMLDLAFYETPEYFALQEVHKRRIVVGRRGTGKSALYYKLKQFWRGQSKTLIVELRPNEAEVIGLRYFVKVFGEKSSHLRSACSTAWQYAILNEILVALVGNYKIKAEFKETARVWAQRWNNQGDSITERLFSVLEQKVRLADPSETRLAHLATSLEIKSLLKITKEILEEVGYSIHVVADKLDDGYEPDSVGVSILTGLLYALDKLSIALPNTNSIAFFRDNIFRAVQLQDADYSRNLEGDVLRLHWDEQQLFGLLCNRLKIISGIKNAKNLKIWDSLTARDLRGVAGFRACLRLTLYRPRDLLVLINKAFNSALSHNRDKLDNDDIDASAKEISCARLDDLKKEYREIIPGLDKCIDVFAGKPAKLTYNQVCDLLEPVLKSDQYDVADVQTLKILGSVDTIVRCLYSLGFLGVFKSEGGSFVFCHDGKSPDLVVAESSDLLIHPCYWIALNLSEESLEPSKLEEIHDEYDIAVSKETPLLRNKQIGKIIAELDEIPLGLSGASAFEKWCFDVLSIVFAGRLTNLELKPNNNQGERTQLRDIVATNNGKTDVWARLLNSYGCGQIIFEVKNFDHDLGPDEYRQMLSYLTKEYGKLGFIINRSKEISLRKEKELKWVREIYYKHDNRLIVKLNSTILRKWLSKLRNPEKKHFGDDGLESILVDYERRYV